MVLYTNWYRAQKTTRKTTIKSVLYIHPPKNENTSLVVETLVEDNTLTKFAMSKGQTRNLIDRCSQALPCISDWLRENGASFRCIDHLSILDAEALALMSLMRHMHPGCPRVLRSLGLQPSISPRLAILVAHTRDGSISQWVELLLSLKESAVKATCEWSKGKKQTRRMHAYAVCISMPCSLVFRSFCLNWFHLREHFYVEIAETAQCSQCMIFCKIPGAVYISSPKHFDVFQGQMMSSNPDAIGKQTL